MGGPTLSCALKRVWWYIVFSAAVVLTLVLHVRANTQAHTQGGELPVTGLGWGG